MNQDRLSGAAVLVAIGLALGGWFVGHGFAKGRSTDRFVTVKGVSEREVKADLALWPLRLVVGDNDLARAQNTLARNTREVMTFLAQREIDTAQAELQGIRVVDVLNSLSTMRRISRSSASSCIRESSSSVDCSSFFCS